MADARGDVLRGLQVVESAISIPNMLMGDKLEVSKDMDTETRRAPLGVGAAICPFNFPAMIPLWSIPYVSLSFDCIFELMSWKNGSGNWQFFDHQAFRAGSRSFYDHCRVGRTSRSGFAQINLV